ncbi:MAG: hypothetical protein JNL30_11115 [Rubrivivax sp.]|nr:hypothetical protein [Rubrivivax sp.]
MQWTVLVVLASLACMALSARMPWTAEARACGLALAVAAGMAPLALSMAAVAALWLLPGAAPVNHVLAVGGLLSIIAAAGARRLKGVVPRLQRRPGVFGWIAGLLLLGYVVALSIDSVTVPLIQNDALEYAIAARELYQARALDAYPALHPEQSASGFFGPWTHPPAYVALIYLGYSLAGGAESAAALRWIAPWCLLACVALVFAIGRLHSQRAAWVAAAMLVSTPLLFLGAASALIDPLPVLGFTLGLAGLAGLVGSAWTVGLAAGCLLGLGLWTHSQAVLFPFLLLPLLALVQASRAGGGAAMRWRAATLSTAVATLAAVGIGLWPYLRNLSRFGSLISDNPLVFALPSLDWPRYFSLQRGVATWQEVLQYGVLKGFFAIEAYSLVFWLALVALPVAWRSTVQTCRAALGGVPGPGPLAALALAPVVMYLAATALSASLGIDLMIRNERYLLVIVPCAALMVAVASTDGRRGTTVALCAVVLAGLQLVVLTVYRQGQLAIGRTAGHADAQLLRWGPYGVVRHLAEQSPRDALVLSLKPADMYYARRRMISYLDPRMLAFYASATPAEAAAKLHQLGVTHIHLPDYFLPPVFASQLMELAAASRWTRIAADEAGYQILTLVPPGAAAVESGKAGVPTELPASSAPWQRVSQWVLGGRKALKRVDVRESRQALGVPSINRGIFGFFGRDTAQSLRSPEYSLPTQTCPADAQAELTARVQFRGRAHVQLLALMQGGEAPVRRLLGDRPTSPGGAATMLARRLVVPPGVRSLRLALEHSGESELVVDSAQVEFACVAVRR